MATKPRKHSEILWIGLGEASRSLGVNESTLRRWSDAGLVQTFRTPGGHRRFSAADLRRLVNETETESQKFITKKIDIEAMRRIRSGLIDDANKTQTWMSQIPTSARAEMADLGRETVLLIERYLSTAKSESAQLASMETTAEKLGRRYGTLIKGCGVNLSDAILAFAYFRRGMDDAVRTYAQKHALSAHAAGRLWERVSILEDRLLLNLTSIYESNSLAPIDSQSNVRENF